MPDLHVEIADYRRATRARAAHGTDPAKLYGAPATQKRHEASVFDWVRLENELIVERPSVSNDADLYV